MLETILILNATALLTNTTVVIIILYRIGVRVFKHETKRP
jgi:hypothetical protein